MTTCIGSDATQVSGCLVAEPRSVEARFGLGSCRPRGDDCHCDVELGKWALDPDGRVQLGALAVGADHITGEAPFIRRPAGHWSLTTELTIDFVAPVMPGAKLHLRSRPTRIERSGGFADGEMLDEQGRVVVVCSTRTLYVPSTPIAPAAARLAVTAAEKGLTALSLDEHLKLECRDDESDDDAIQVRLDDSSSWQNDYGILHGGVWACLTEVAASRLIARVRPGLTTASVHTVYLRPGAAGTPVIVSARIRYVGSRLALLECTGKSDDGTVCTLSTVTARRLSDIPD